MDETLMGNLRRQIGERLWTSSNLSIEGAAGEVRGAKGRRKVQGFAPYQNNFLSARKPTLRGKRDLMSAKVKFLR